MAVPEADIHLLKHIIHDWDDEQSILILSNCARTLRPKGRVVLVQRVMPEDDRRARPLSDLNMLVVLPGRRRTVREYAGLIARAGSGSIASPIALHLSVSSKHLRLDGAAT